MREPFVIGNLTVQPGSKGRGFVQATNRAGGEPLGMPLMIVHGAEDGPTFTVVSGVHGDEYEGSEAIIRIWRDLDPAKLRGTFIGVPTANVPAREKGWRISSIDYLNLARIFPGKESGVPSERIAHTLFTQIVMRSDYLIDAHAGGVDLLLAPVVHYREGEDEALNARILELAKATGLPYLCHAPKLGSGELPDEAMRKGVVAINMEVGGEGRCRENCVETDVKVITNVLKYLKMIDGEPERPKTQMIMRDISTLRVSVSGLWHHRPDLAPESFVKKGETVGTVSNLFGDVLETITAPHDGMLTMLRSFPTIPAGNWVAFLGQTVEPVSTS